MSGPYDQHPTAHNLVQDYAHIIKGKVILTTGVSSGSLGGYFVQSIAKASPSCLILAARNVDKLQQTATEITTAHPEVQVRTLQVDLASLKSVREAADQVINRWNDIPAIDVLVNNAGIMAVDYKLSPDGFESQFATNHLGPFLFTNLILPKVVASKAPRVVVVSSELHRLSPLRFGDYNFDGGKTYHKWVAYGQGKSANILFAISLAKKLHLKHNLLAFSLHPGVIATNLGSHLDQKIDVGELRSTDRRLGNREGWEEPHMKQLDRGTATHVYAAFDPALRANNGAYLTDCHVADPLVDTVSAWATNDLEAERLWRLSEKLVGQEFPY